MTLQDLTELQKELEGAFWLESPRRRSESQGAFSNGEAVEAFQEVARGAFSCKVVSFQGRSENVGSSLLRAPGMNVRHCRLVSSGSMWL